MDFASDNTAPVHPDILAALGQANVGPAIAYGEDALSKAVEAQIQDLFEAPQARVFFAATGTAANALALASCVPPWGSILAHREAHIETDECGAPEFFTGGSKLVLIDGPGAKVRPADLEEALTRNRRGVHSVTPRALSLTQASERGCAYRPEEVAALTAIARREGLVTHMDGARFANAVAFLGCSPAAVSAQAGVDVLCFGATKNGAIAAEAIIVFNETLADDLAFRRKRAGHLLCKGRFVAAQFGAYLKDGLWLALASRANALAHRIGRAAGDWLSEPVEANQIFVRAGAERMALLRGQGVRFYDWGPPALGEGRLVVRYDQPEDEVDRLCDILAGLRGDEPF
ncbi:MAG: threonine aldolase family protein [Caulobacterales bacterium]|jgi:threonine aldolase